MLVEVNIDADCCAPPPSAPCMIRYAHAIDAIILAMRICMDTFRISLIIGLKPWNFVEHAWLVGLLDLRLNEGRPLNEVAQVFASESHQVFSLPFSNPSSV